MTDLHAKPELTTIPVGTPPTAPSSALYPSIPRDRHDQGPRTAPLPTRMGGDGRQGRKPWLMKFQNWILDNAEHITDVVQSESGKPRAEASIEAPMSADLLNYFARNAEAFLADRRPRPHNPLMITSG